MASYMPFPTSGERVPVNRARSAHNSSKPKPRRVEVVSSIDTVTKDYADNDRRHDTRFDRYVN